MMRLAELYVDGFGILNELHLGQGDLGKRITVIYGMNEAGKSTLMGFIQAILFGFKVKGRYGGEPLRGGRLGGYLVFISDQGEQYKVERAPRGKQGKITVTMPDGTVGDEKFLQDRILKNITPLVFRNVFAFGVDELRRLEELGASEVSAHVYGAGTGLRPGRLTAGQSRLQEEMNELFRPGGAKPAINRLLKELGGVTAAVRQFQQEPKQYKQLKKEVVFLRGEREKLEAEKREVELHIHRLKAVIRARESWVCLEEARQRFEKLPVIVAFPESGKERLQALEEQVRETRLARDETDRQAQELQNRLSDLKINYLLIEQSTAIKALEGERGLQLERLRRLPELVAEVAHAQEEYKKQERKLGSAYDRKQLDSVETSLLVREMAEGFILRFVAAENRLKDAKGEVTRLESSAGERKRDLAVAESALAAHKVQAPLSGRPPAVREQALDVLDAGMRRISLLRNNLGQLRTRFVELEQQKADTERELAAQPLRYLPNWLLVVLAVLLAVLITAVFSIGETLGFLALAAGAVIMVLVWQAARRAAKSEAARLNRLGESLKNLQQLITGVTREIEQLSSQEETLAEELKEASWIALGRLVSREEEIPAARRALEEEKRKQARMDELTHTIKQLTGVLDREWQKLSTAKKNLVEAETAQAGLVEEWLCWLKERGLPPSLTPSGTITFYDALEEAGKRYQAWQKNVILERETRCQAEAFLDRLNALLTRAGQGAATLENACERVIRLGEELAEAAQLVGEKVRLQEQIDSQIAQKQRLENTLDALIDEMNALLAEGGAVNPEEFRRRAACYGERKQVVGEMQAYERDLKIIAGSPSELVFLKQDLRQSKKSENDRELICLIDRIKELEIKINEAGEKIGRLDNRISLLENSEGLAARLQEREMLLSAIKLSARKWQVRALCLRLLNMAKERHELERQPAVLQRASEYIRKITSGAYTRVIAPAGRADLLEIEASSGGRVALPGLSRGTASQLYLSVRLALAHQYSGVGLPVILDDILVDFDRDRLRGAMQVLGDFSRRRQVILFTCHDHVLGVIDECLDDFGLVRLPGRC